MPGAAAAGAPTAVWIALPDAAAAGDPARLLTPEECARYRRYHHDDDARRFLTGRVLARHLVAQALGCRPRDVALTVDPAGRPRAVHPAAPSFSITHSGTWVGCAVWQGGAVGFDLEPLAHGALALSLTRDYCSADERAALARHPPDAARRHALQLWTLKEAWAKANGRGLDDPRRTAFALDDPITLHGADAREAWQFITGGDDACIWALALRPAVAGPVCKPAPRRLDAAAWAHLAARGAST